MSTGFIALLCLLSALIGETHGLRCFDSCHFVQPLDAPLVIADHCNKTRDDFLCQTSLTVDYTLKKLHVTFGSEYFPDRKRAIGDKYDYVQERTTVARDSIRTRLVYTCTLDDQCEEKFLLVRAAKLVQKDYTTMQNRLMDLFPSTTSSELTCNFGSQPGACNGTCYGERNQFLDPKTGEPVKTFEQASCDSSTASPRVTIDATKIPMSARSVLGRSLELHCSTNRCNNVETNDRIEKIVNDEYRAFYQE